MYYKFVVYQCQRRVIIIYITGRYYHDRRFHYYAKKCRQKEDKSITMTIRLDRELQEEYDELAAKSGRSRNELMCKALRYALDNLKFVDTEARQ